MVKPSPLQEVSEETEGFLAFTPVGAIRRPSATQPLKKEGQSQRDWPSFFNGARGGIRTHMEFNLHMALNHARLPVPPPGHKF